VEDEVILRDQRCLLDWEGTKHVFFFFFGDCTRRMLRSVLYSENAARQIPKPPMTFENSGEGLRRTDVMATESRASSVHGKRWNPADAKTKKGDMTVDTQRT
jgi:hypothetical protein